MVSVLLKQNFDILDGSRFFFPRWARSSVIAEDLENLRRAGEAFDGLRGAEVVGFREWVTAQCAPRLSQLELEREVMGLVACYRATWRSWPWS